MGVHVRRPSGERDAVQSLNIAVIRGDGIDPEPAPARVVAATRA